VTSTNTRRVSYPRTVIAFWCSCVRLRGRVALQSLPQPVLQGVQADQPRVRRQQGVLTGPIPRAYPEKNYPGGIEVRKDGAWVEDNLPEDMSLVFNTDRGLVLLAGCGHAGLINTLQYARQFLRPAPVDAAIIGIVDQVDVSE